MDCNRSTSKTGNDDFDMSKTGVSWAKVGVLTGLAQVSSTYGARFSRRVLTMQGFYGHQFIPLGFGPRDKAFVYAAKITWNILNAIQNKNIIHRLTIENN
jgi:hypothetical protein